MFESAEIGHQVDKKTYKSQAPVLRGALLDAQYRLLAQARHAVVVLVNGVDGAGKGETVNLLNEWMDPRHIRTEAFGPANEHERLHPDMWRFWQVLPPKGHIGILFGSWYTDPILGRALGEDDHDRFARRLERIRRFERMLSAEGVVLVKFWFHLSKKAAKARFKALEADPRTAWRVTPQEWGNLRHYDDFIRVSDEALRKTSLAEAPWRVVEGADEAYRSLAVGRQLLEALKQATQSPPTPVPEGLPAADLKLPTERPPAPFSQGSLDDRSLLSAFDYQRRLARKVYDHELETWQGRLNGLSRDPRLAQRGVVIVFEGMDAAGKGSTIRRVTQSLDARRYRVVPVAAPNENERAQPYLWRFWRYIPKQAHFTVFDRSWYGRVLVERVEGFCEEADWRRAYDEINAFEEELSESGVVAIKFWLAITEEEQLSRFQQRQDTPHKQYKITQEDWRNREKWPLYERAVDEMIDRTSTQLAPWHVVASDDKLWTRIEVLRTVCERLETALAR